MGKRNYDFAGWVTKNDILCSDGVTIKHDAFRDNDGQKVPLVWNHDYNSPTNVLGHVLLHNQEKGVYGYGYFNDTDEAQKAKELIKHGDISSMSIGARKIKRNGNNVIHGHIYEVSLVLSGANPGAMIETVVTHSDDGNSEEKGIVYTGTLIHSFDDILDHKDEGGETEVKKSEELKHSEKSEELTHSEKTIGDVIETLTNEQKDAVYALLGMVASGDEEKDEKEEKEEGDEGEMKQNVFSKGQEGKEQDTLKHSYTAALKLAQANKASSLKDVIIQQAGEETLTHGINSIEMLFPDAAKSTNGNVPILYRDTNTAAMYILDGVAKSPFSRVKTVVADLTEEEARAKGYIKGNMKKEEFFSLIKRHTQPTTVYKKQKLDRDDVIDITDFDVVAFMNVEMQAMLKEEIARALLIGDGRDFSSEDKISELNIRPIITDHEFFTIKKNFANAAAFIEVVIKAMAEYKGSGNPDMFIDPMVLADIKLLKGSDGHFLFGDIPSNEAIANRLGLNKVVPSTFMTGKGALIVNLRDYTLGATKGGQITNFDDFDIDFNQYKYLIETRLSGALTLPKSAIHLAVGATAGTGATATDAGLTYGARQADKTTTTTTTTV